MKRPRMRPVFEIDLEVSGDELLQRMRERLARKDCHAEGNVLRAGAELSTCERNIHFWSPHLSLEIRDREGGGKYVVGRFGPNPGLWMLFMTAYATIGLGGTLAAMFGISQWILNQPPWAFAGVPLAVFLAGFTYGAVFIGQGLGAEEMYMLRSFVDHCIDGPPDSGRSDLVVPPGQGI